MLQTVEIMAKKKGSATSKWQAMSTPVATVEEAKRQIRGRSNILDSALDFAVRTVYLEEYSERD